MDSRNSGPTGPLRKLLFLIESVLKCWLVPRLLDRNMTGMLMQWLCLWTSAASLTLP